MPSIWAYSLNSWLKIVLHHLVPLIKPAIHIAIGFEIIITIFFNCCIIGLLISTSNSGSNIQVLSHPALGSNLYCIVGLSITVINDVLATTPDNRITFIKNIDPKVNLTMQVPKMMIQSHAENAIKHGLLPKIEQGLLTIDIAENENQLVISIADNGVGRSHASGTSKQSTGVGNQMMREFFVLYQKATGQKISYEIEDLYDENRQPNGTKVHINIAFEN